VHGCLAAAYDKDFTEATIYFTRECFCWMITILKNGGSIATLGHTAVAYGDKGRNFTNYLSGFLSSRFFEVYGNGTDILGDIWKEEVTLYVDKFDAQNNILDCKSVESWALIGDPSLKIG
jgi:hypothetical protein